MNFNQHYTKAVLESGNRSFDPNINNLGGLREFADILDNNIPGIISKQEAAVIVRAKFEQDIMLSDYLNQEYSQFRTLLKHILDGLDIELAAIWTTPWNTTKLAANLLLPPPGGPGFPVSLYYTAPPPVSPAIAGTALVFPESSFVKGYVDTQYMSKPSVYRPILTTAIGSFIAEQYVTYAATGPKPYLPLIVLP